MKQQRSPPSQMNMTLAVNVPHHGFSLFSVFYFYFSLQKLYQHDVGWINNNRT